MTTIVAGMFETLGKAEGAVAGPPGAAVGAGIGAYVGSLVSNSPCSHESAFEIAGDCRKGLAQPIRVQPEALFPNTDRRTAGPLTRK